MNWAEHTIFGWTLAEHTTKNKISWLMSKYKHGNNIHEHGK